MTSTTPALSRQRTAVTRRIRMALATYHSEVRKADRDGTLYDAEKQAAKAAARDKAMAEIHAAKADIASANAADRAARQYVDQPTGTDLQQRLYWQGAAAGDLAGLSGEAAAALIGNLVASGATAQAAEYVRAARPVLTGEDYGRLRRATMPKAAMDAEAWAQGMEAYEAHLAGWLDHHVDNLLHAAGTIQPEERQGEPSTYDDRALTVCCDTAERAAVDAYQQHAAYLTGGDAPQAGDAPQGGEGA